MPTIEPFPPRPSKASGGEGSACDAFLAPLSRDAVVVFGITLAVTAACAITSAYATYWSLDMGDCNYDIHIHLYKGICIRGSANDACIRWNTLEDLSDDAADSIEDVYRPAFALCITAFALSCALSLICVVQSVLPVTKSYVLQAILFIGSTMTVAFLAVALYETSSTYLTHPSNYDDCPNASSGGAPGYTACAIGVGTSAAVTILSLWPVFAGFQAAGYDIQVQPVVLPQIIA